MPATCRQAMPQDFPALQRMLELYQYELSDIWDQDLDAQGSYGYDLRQHAQARHCFAHVALVNGHHAGFALVAPAAISRQQGCWMEQFFILKKYRHARLGETLARHVFDSHPGPWAVGQMPLNLAAQAFWRRVIGRLSGGHHTELQITQGHWQGVVQHFDHHPAA